MKKLTSILLTLLLMLNTFSMTIISVNAVDVPELPLDTVVDSCFTINGESKNFKFTIEQPAYVSIGASSDDITMSNKKITYALYTDNMEAKLAQTKEYVSSYLVGDLYIRLEAGTYYLVLTSNSNFEFNIQVNAKYYTNTEAEPNNNFHQAQQVQPDEVVHGLISATDNIDFYKITLSERQRVTMYTLGTHYENYYDSYEWISEAIAFEIYKERHNSSDKFYTNINKESCYYSYDFKDEDFMVEYDGFVVDNEKWEQTEDMVLDAGTYYFAFRFDTLDKTDYYRFMYKLSEPVPTIYNKYEKNEFNLSYESVSAGDNIHLRVCDGEVVSWTAENPKVAKVNKNGKVTALTKGKTAIIATLANGEKLKCILTVTSDPTLKVNNKKVTSISINKGEKITVKIKGKATEVNNKYTSTKVAKISGNKNAKKFTVKGLKKGTTTLKITVNGKKLLLKVSVK